MGHILVRELFLTKKEVLEEIKVVRREVEGEARLVKRKSWVGER